MDEMSKEKVIQFLNESAGKGIQCALDAVSQLLENPLLMNDVTYRLLANTENTATDDPLWNEIMELGTFSHETVDFFKTEKFIEAYATSDCVARMTSDKLKYDRANISLFDTNGVQIANICVVAIYRPFKENDFELMKIAGDFISEQLVSCSYYDELSKVFQETMISSLIRGEGRYDKNNEEALVNLYEGLSKNLFVAIIDVIEYDNTLTHLEYFRSCFSKLCPKYKYFIHLNNIVAIISSDEPFINIKRDLAELDVFFKKNKIYAGISDSFYDFNEMDKYFKQALNALNFGLNIGVGRNIFLFNNFRLETAVNSCFENLKELRHPIVSYIYEYDKTHSTAFADLLLTYLLNKENIKETAKSLGINQSQVCKDIATVQNLFVIDFEDNSELSSILIFLKLYKCFKEKL